MITYSKPEVFRNVLLSFSLAKHIGQAFGVQGTFILHVAFTFVRPEKVRTKCVCLTPFFIVTFDSFTTGSTLYTILLDNRFRNVIQHHNSILLCRLDRYCYYCSSWSHALKYPSKLMRRLSHSYTGSVGQTCKKKKKWREKKEIEMHLEKRAWKREIASKKKQYSVKMRDKNWTSNTIQHQKLFSNNKWTMASCSGKNKVGRCVFRLQQIPSHVVCGHHNETYGL